MPSVKMYISLMALEIGLNHNLMYFETHKMNSYIAWLYNTTMEFYLPNGI